MILEFLEQGAHFVIAVEANLFTKYRVRYMYWKATQAKPRFENYDMAKDEDIGYSI